MVRRGVYLQVSQPLEPSLTVGLGVEDEGPDTDSSGLSKPGLVETPDPSREKEEDRGVRVDLR